ncbi:MAG: orotate phosphoribosyltransferase, partial [Alphaproteobacteria bacterium]
MAVRSSTPTPAPGDAVARSIARSLLDIGAVSMRPEAPFTLTSGKPSPVYVDCRRIISFPSERNQIITAAVAQIDTRIGRTNIDMVAGGETAGIPYAAWLADRLGCPMLYVRKKPKGFGRNAQIEGVVKEGARVLLAEDMTTDGGSKMVFIDALRNAGAVVKECWVTFRYGEAAVARLAEVGV